MYYIWPWQCSYKKVGFLSHLQCAFMKLWIWAAMSSRVLDTVSIGFLMQIPHYYYQILQSEQLFLSTVSSLFWKKQNNSLRLIWVRFLCVSSHYHKIHPSIFVYCYQSSVVDYVKSNLCFRECNNFSRSPKRLVFREY